MKDGTAQLAIKEVIWNDELEALPLTWTFEELERQTTNKSIDFDIAFQRGYVWDNKRNSDYIQSILCGMTTGIFLLNKIGNKYEGLDGKQRSFSVCEYLKNNYKLHKNTEPVIFEGKKYNIGGCLFQNLPEELQTRIKGRTIDIYWFNGLSSNNKIKVFTRVNSGRPVTTADIARIKVKSRSVFLELVNHPAIKNGVRPIDIKKCVDEDIVKWIWCICNNESPNLLQSYTSKILEVTEVTQEQKTELIQVLDYIEALFKELSKGDSKNKKTEEQKKSDYKKIFSKIRLRTHFVMVGYMASIAIEKNISKEKFIKKAIELFNVEEGRAPTISDKYNEAMKGGTAKPEQVKARMNEIDKFMK